MNNEILDLIQDRLELGAKKYGKPNMVSDGRDFVKESLEEILDCCIWYFKPYCEKDFIRWAKSVQEEENYMTKDMDYKYALDSVIEFLKALKGDE